MGICYIGHRKFRSLSESLEVKTRILKLKAGHLGADILERAHGNPWPAREHEFVGMCVCACLHWPEYKAMQNGDMVYYEQKLASQLTWKALYPTTSRTTIHTHIYSNLVLTYSLSGPIIFIGRFERSWDYICSTSAMFLSTRVDACLYMSSLKLHKWQMLEFSDGTHLPSLCTQFCWKAQEVWALGAQAALFLLALLKYPCCDGSDLCF